MGDVIALAEAPVAACYPQLTHYSKKPLGKVRSVRQIREVSMKPLGLWVSDDAEYGGEAMGWPHWCEAEQFSVDRMEVRSIVSLAAPGRLLWLGSVEEIDGFHAEFAEPMFRDYRLIRWDRVAEVWAGIVITPYQWARRFDDKAKWYYSWDCASGCIWDASVIASVEPAPSLPMLAERG
jgi:hypothetical protein